MKGTAIAAACIVSFFAGLAIFFLSLSGLVLHGIQISEWAAALGLVLVISPILILLAGIFSPIPD